MTDLKALDALLPCPFCGGEAELEQQGTPRQSHIIACIDCGCRLETGETWKGGRDWNTRTGKLAPVDGDAVERDMIEADERLGAWMSAALDDPSVCDAMKRDIENWFASFRATLTNGGEHEG